MKQRGTVTAMVLALSAFAFGQNHALLPQYQGMVGVSWTTALTANALPAVDSYEFEVSTAGGLFTEVVSSLDESFTLSETSLGSQLQRDITVRVRTINGGQTSSFGPSVLFTTSGAQMLVCGFGPSIEELVNDYPDPQAFFDWREQTLQQALPNVSAQRDLTGCQTAYTIPVVFHVIHNGTGSFSDVPDNFILDQLQILNDEFNGPNPNTLGENTCIRFCLAQNTPNGEDWATDFGSSVPGITRWNDANATIHFMTAASQTQLANIIYFPPDQYLNVWIVSEIEDGPLGIAGYATFPGSALPLDGIVVENLFMADYGNIFGYEEGKIMVHEAGHYLGLWHTFQNQCLPPGDECADTPPVAGPNMGSCVDLTPLSCGQPEQLENYMDYTFDQCKTTFTGDQIDRMHTSILVFRSNLVQTANLVATGVAGPNGCETNILTAAFTSNGTQFCTTTSTATFTGVANYDTWTFSFSNPDGTIAPVTGTGLPLTTPIAFPNAGAWFVTLTVSNTTTPPLGTATESSTVYVSDCGNIILQQGQWHFGNFCALDFTSGVATPMPSSIVSSEGCASICSSVNGATEFYASNLTAFDAAGTALAPNLIGGPLGSSAQGAMFVPDPGNPDRYYLFTTMEWGTGPGQLHFSIVDRTLNGGLGDFVPGMVNISVGAGEPSVTEQLSTVPHCNGVDYWVIVHGADATSFDQLIAYHLTPGGIIGSVSSPAHAVPIWTNGAPFNLAWAGQIEFNHEGDIAAITNRDPIARCRIYSFDRASGQFNFLTALATGTTDGYGVSFSRSGNFLYTRTFGGIWQHDFRDIQQCSSSIPNNYHEYEVYTAAFAAMQLGPDDKIYVGHNLALGYPDWVSVINYPEIWNATPNAFGFNWGAIDLEILGNGVNEDVGIGLPNEIDARPTAGLLDFRWCSIDCGTVTFDLLGCGSMIQWDVDCNGTIDGTGDPFTWTFPGPGSYCVSLNADGVQVTHTVDIVIPPVPDIQPDVVCLGVPTVFSSTNTAGLDHQWSITGSGTIMTPSNGPTVEIIWSGSGTISIVVTDAITGCTNSVTVTVNPVNFQPDLGPDVAVCPGESTTLTELNGAVTCSWTPVSDLNLANPCAPVFMSIVQGTYDYSMVGIGANGCVGTDDVTVTVDPAGCDPFTITKTVNDAFTYAGAPVLYTITVCNNTATGQNVDLTDYNLTNFVATSTNPSWPTFPAGSITFFVDAMDCETVEIAGYFTALGTYTNCAEADPANEDPVSACAEAVTVLQNCPLVVFGSGNCAPGSDVQMCLGIHSLIADVKEVNFLWVFPTFLDPPLNFAGASTPTLAGGINGTSTIGPELPWAGMPGYSYVAVHLVYNNALPTTQWIYSLLCLNFTLAGPVTPGVNLHQTFASTLVQPIPNNHVELLDSGDSPIQPGGFWTQPANIILTGCPGVVGPNADFTIDHVLCTGEVSVTGLLTDPNAIHMWTWGDDRTTPTNGAQQYTYNYFAAIPINQDPPYSVPPAPPGTYTITHTVILNGAASSSSQLVTVAPCCVAATVIPNGSLASVVGTVFSGTIDVQGKFFVDDDVLFQNCQVYMEPGSEIIVQNGWTLDIDNASFTACNGVMWKSITAQNGATVRIRGSYMDDAESTVAALDGSTVWIDGTQFHNNRVGVGIPDVGATYNNVACWVSNSTFYSAGTMPQPYQGQTTAVGNKGFAAVDVHNTTMDFTGGNNIIHTLSNGIIGHGSDMSVAECQMFNIKPDAAYAYSGNGAGIYANGINSWNTLKQQGFGMTGMPSFNGCRWGVYTEYMNVRSTDNRMLDMGTAYRVDRSGYKEVDILNNKVFTHLHGMELRANDGAAHILVQNNDITFGDAQCDLCRGYTAILVTEGNYVAPDSRILNNIIRFMNAPNSRFGIALTSADDWVVAENDVIMASNAFNLTGIQMTGCRRTEVSCNSVNSGDNTYPIDRQAAIRNVMGREPLISCNEMDQTANGILFNGVAYNTDVRGNQFHDHRWPLHLDATAIIDVQTLKGNLWDPNATAPAWGAWYEVAPLQAAAYRFWYNPITVGAQPPSWSPSNWFAFDPGVNYDCANHHGAHYCSQFGGERCKDCIRELDEKIASDSLENNPYTDETKWMLAADLYKKLDESPALLDSLPELDAFYTTLQGSATAAFKAIADDQLALYGLDSSVVAQLQANRTQIETFMTLVKDGLEQLGDSTLTPAQRQTILGGITGFRQNINNLTAWNATALQVASTSKVLTADGVKAANSGIATSELIEMNEKQVNEIYLATIGKDVDDFTSTQTDDLFAIANQCPMLGGNAVFKARSLYWLIDDSYDFDDQLLCLPHGIIVKSLTQQPLNGVAVVPNPASDEATLVLDRELEGPGTFVVYDAVGAEVMRQAVPIEMPRMAFSTASLAPALYHYQVRGPSGIIGVGKLTIVR